MPSEGDKNGLNYNNAFESHYSLNRIGDRVFGSRLNRQNGRIVDSYEFSLNDPKWIPNEQKKKFAPQEYQPLPQVRPPFNGNRSGYRIRRDHGSPAGRNNKPTEYSGDHPFVSSQIHSYQYNTHRVWDTRIGKPIDFRQFTMYH